MTSEKIKKISGLCTLLILTAAGPAQASSVATTQYYNLDDDVQSFGRAALYLDLDDSTTLYFDKFDPALGTLNAVEFRFSGRQKGTGGVTFSSNNPDSIDSGNASIQGITSFSGLGLSYTAKSGYVTDTHCRDFASTCETDLGFKDDFVSPELLMNSASILENYTGSGSIAVSLASTAHIAAYQVVAEDLYNLSAAYVLSSRIAASITYHYSDAVIAPDPTPVPLPASFWLFASALSGFTGLIRKKKNAH